VLRSIQRRTRLLFNETLPMHVYAVTRLAVGVIYFWFGLLKFPFVPGGSPADPLIAAWAPLIPTPIFMLVLAVFETTAGVLLLLGVGVRVVATVLLFHVLGTFATVVVGSDQVFNLRYGFYSLTLAGQYIVKNLLLLAAFFALATTRPRRHPRWPLIAPARVTAGERAWSAVTRNVSRTGVSFYIRTPDAPLAPGDAVSLSVQAPLGEQELALAGHVRHCSRAKDGVWVIGCDADDLGGVLAALAPWISDDAPQSVSAK
jgi:uncharacterized membrane protein YphA (DoxX/SURF4 family)